MPDWDEKLWRLATNRPFLVIVALLQMKQIAETLHGGAPMTDVLVVQWFIPLACTLVLSFLVALYGMRHFWSLTQMVLVGMAVVMLADPVIKAYVGVLVQGG